MKFEQIVKPDQWILSQTFTVKVEEIPQVIGPTFMKLGGFIQEQGIQILSTPFVSYKNMDENGGLDESAIEMEVGFPWQRKSKCCGDRKRQLFPSVL